MCIKCAMGMTNESVKEQLENAIINKNFDKINTTSIHFILYACIGIFGNKSKHVGLEFIKMFIEWLKTKEQKYVPSTGFEQMYHYTILIKLTKWCENNDIAINDDEPNSDNKRTELFESLQSKINELLNE